jgi:hypothetical protein
MSRSVPIITVLLLTALAMGCVSADDKSPARPHHRATKAAQREKTRPDATTEMAAQKLLVEIRRERETAFHAPVTERSSDSNGADAGVPEPATENADGAAEADRLMRRGQSIGMQAKRENNLKKGRLSIKLFRQATTVAPDYRPAWEKYFRTLKNVRKRFGHSIVMHDSEINSEISRCKKALARLP